MLNLFQHILIINLETELSKSFGTINNKLKLKIKY